jgi:hypothetical protein
VIGSLWSAVTARTRQSKSRLGGSRGTTVGQPTLGTPHMDDKTINLWRQIESYRLRNKAPATRRSKPPAAPSRQARPE